MTMKNPVASYRELASLFSMLIFINGNMVGEEDANVSVFDRGFLYGDGVFETLRSYKGVIFHIDNHIDRLFESANAIYLRIPFTREYLSEVLYKTLRENNLMEAYLRLMITRGEGEPGLNIDGCTNPGIIVIPKAFNGYPEKTYTEGISAAIVKTRRIPPSALNPSIKSLNFLNNIMARIEARKLDASEGIMLSTEGYVAEGTVCNIFIIKNGIIKTPALSVGILNGVTRSIVIGLATKNNLTILEQPFPPDEIYDADECFITSTLYEVMPVTKINGRSLGNGKPGVFTKRLLQYFRLNVMQDA